MTKQIVFRKDALANGYSRYFTGRPCKNGHIEQRQTSNKGCVSCLLERGSKWRAANIDEIRRRDRIIYAANPEKAALKNKSRDAEKMRDSSRRWYSLNKKRARERHLKWCAENPGHKSEISRKWHANNRDRQREHGRKRRAIKLNASGSHSKSDIDNIRRLQSARCAYCRCLLGKKYHIDHIFPMSKGGSNGRSNLQLTCVSCNLKKHALDPLDFARRCGMLL